MNTKLSKMNQGDFPFERHILKKKNMYKILIALMFAFGLLISSGCSGDEQQGASQEDVAADSVAQEVEEITTSLEMKTDSLKLETESTAAEVEQLLEGI